MQKMFDVHRTHLTPKTGVLEAVGSYRPQSGDIVRFLHLFHRVEGLRTRSRFKCGELPVTAPARATRIFRSKLESLDSGREK